MITLYTKTNCPYCTMAKDLLTENNISYHEVNIEEIFTAREFMIENGHKTVPQIYFNNEVLVEGGYVGLTKINIHQLKEQIYEAA